MDVAVPSTPDTNPAMANVTLVRRIFMVRTQSATATNNVAPKITCSHARGSNSNIPAAINDPGILPNTAGSTRLYCSDWRSRITIIQDRKKPVSRIGPGTNLGSRRNSKGAATKARPIPIELCTSTAQNVIRKTLNSKAIGIMSLSLPAEPIAI